MSYIKDSSFSNVINIIREYFKKIKKYTDDKLKLKTDQIYTDEKLKLKADQTYVDSNFSSVRTAIGSLTGTPEYVDKILLKSGGTMTGDLMLNKNPQSDMQASTKKYVDDRVSEFVPLSGGTMTGKLILPDGEPTDGKEAVTKDYVDSKKPPVATTTTVGVVKVGDGLSVTGDGTVSSNVSESYVDNKISELKIVMSHQYSFFESGTFIKPKGLTTFNVLAIGGKGGKGHNYRSFESGHDFGADGGNGGSGDVVYKQLVLPNDEMSIPITIGANGANGSSSTHSSSGGSTLFGSYITAIGGTGGENGTTWYGGTGGNGYYGGSGGSGMSGNTATSMNDKRANGGDGGNGYYGGDGGNGGDSISDNRSSGSGGNGGNGIYAGHGGEAGINTRSGPVGTDGRNGSSGYNPTTYGNSASVIPSFVSDLRTPAVYIWW